jgi:D-2-hydroxyacid dehydrogenase (NADP+)
MKIAIGVVSPESAWVLPRRLVPVLRSQFPQHEFLEAWDRAALREILRRADVAFAAFVDKDIVESLEKLQWVQAPAVGVGHILSPEFVASPIVLTTARGVRARAIAEHVIAVTFALARLLPLTLERQRASQWALDEIENSGRVRTMLGKRMGLVGLGAIGAEVAQLASACGFRVSAVRRRIDRAVPPGVDNVLPAHRLHDLLAMSDVVVLCAAETADTKELINEAAVAAIKPGAFLVNVARGRIVNDAAIVEALADGRLGGAALDVFTREPLAPDSPYWKMPNVIVTPHSSGTMEDYWTPLVALFADNLRRFENGEPLLNVVDKLAGY